jgi:hypothetical protein
MIFFFLTVHNSDNALTDKVFLGVASERNCRTRGRHDEQQQAQAHCQQHGVWSRRARHCFLRCRERVSNKGKHHHEKKKKKKKKKKS